MSNDNRVLLGDRATGGQGLYVSRPGDNVLTTTNPLAFDSRSACTLVVHSYGQGIATSETQVNITHNMGYPPAYAVRWCSSNEIYMGFAQSVFTPNYWEGVDYETYNCGDEGSEDEDDCEESSYFLNQGLIASLGNESQGFRLQLEPYIGGFDEGGESGSTVTHAGRDVYWSYVIFKEPNFTEGVSL
tara:strand:+ start:1084 stop:1644 length:561 start_codon:yes stop_codon:yes gene_type:complete